MIYVSGKDGELLELIGIFLKKKGYNFEIVSMEALFEKCQKTKPRVVFSGNR